MTDSDIDIILHTVHEHVAESVTSILCKNENPAIMSHHDVILSSFTIPTLPTIQPGQVYDIAPKLEHSRTKVHWSEEGQLNYCELVAPHLKQAREKWLDASSQSSMSVLLSITSSIMT